MGRNKSTSSPIPKQAIATKLRIVRHKHAARVAMHARIIQMAARELKKINEAIHEECVEIGGEDYLVDFTVGFEPCESIEQQTMDDIDIITKAGIVDVCAYADKVLEDACAACVSETLPLPCDRTA